MHMFEKFVRVDHGFSNQIIHVSCSVSIFPVGREGVVHFLYLDAGAQSWHKQKKLGLTYSFRPRPGKPSNSPAHQ